MCFKSLHERCRLAPIGSQRAAHNAPYTRGFAAWEEDKKRIGVAKTALSKEGERPLFLWNKSLPLAPLLSVQTKRGMSLSCKCHPILRNSSFWPVLIDRDKAKSRRFSKSKSVCAGRSGNVPRLCAIWTPQCGGMKGSCVLSSAKVGILFRTVEDFVRKMFRFLRMGRGRIKTCGLSCETPLLFSSFSPLF